jgi:hypothetical protein
MGNGTEGCFQVARLRARPEGMWLTVLAGRVPSAFLARSWRVSGLFCGILDG